MGIVELNQVTLPRLSSGVFGQVAAEGDGEVDYRVVVFAALLFCCFAVFVVEMVKRLHPQVTVEKLVALGIAICYLVVVVVVAWVDGVPLGGLTAIVGQLLLVASGALALIWFDDVIGGMVGIKSGLVSKASPGFLIRLMGWVFLLGIIGMSLVFACR